jgi:molybdenum cofactor synthesis domain-containing protein
MNDSLRCALLIVSDRSAHNEREDITGPALEEKIQSYGWIVSTKKILADELEEIRQYLEATVKEDTVDLIFTAGGTGCAPRDVTPEATLAVIEKSVPGLAEAMRQESLKGNLHGMLSRAVAGISHKTLIINLPGNPKAAVENLEAISAVLPHAAALLHSNSDAEAGHQFGH